MTMKVAVTGADGFIGRNLRAHCMERKEVEVLPLVHASTDADWAAAVRDADAVFHLAGVNRPQEPSEFAIGNRDLTHRLCELLRATGRPVPVLYTSSIQAERDNPYGRSKREAEQALLDYRAATGATVHIHRLPNVFGKWARPNYNSAVATFCHNIARGLPIQVTDPAAPVTLAYIDDVVAAFLSFLHAQPGDEVFRQVQPQYVATVGELAEQLQGFRDSRETLAPGRVGTGLARALYATYVSYLPQDAFAYDVPKHGDARGMFVEMLKTPDAGQFSYFTAHPGVTRGGHYHHTKTEKFLVIQGRARFKFRHISGGETFELFTSGAEPRIVDTVPGWSHDITNVGDDALVVMLWANEVFDRAHPDTYQHPV
ncbi:MAG: NAD-dependent epimerase/dehydratase [Ramlibacter sp.]|jgi:UDP-2-acetamido-2,6-beta-L-arabino-hexul-4-ose reductase|nr:NAD-dependent epimerase/dehydratase [Ramlibacter sp.]